MNHKTNPFSKSYDKLFVSKIEFNFFKQQARDRVIDLAKSTKRFQPLEDMFSFYVDNSRVEALQLWFGRRSMFREDGDKVAVETGGTLLYTIGPTGDVAVCIYPMKSSLAKPFEDHIYLRVGTYTGNQLLDCLPGDIKDMVSYCYVTSLDGDPTIFEKARIWWLRHTHAMQVNGEFKFPISFQIGGVAFKFTLQTLFLALLKPLGLAAALALLGFFGMTGWIELLRPKP